MGQKSGFVSTEIEAFVSVEYGGVTVNYCIRTDDPCNQGDSGGPLYSRSYAGNQVYYVTTKGIMVANNTDYGYACAIDKLELNMGLDIDITD
jgi:hypothetical protein